MSAKEKDLYEPVKNALERSFASIGKQAIAETSASKGFSERLKASFPSGSEILFRYMTLRPDIVGSVEPTRLPTMFTVEVKLGSPTIRNVYQAKLYKEVFGASLGFLIATEPIPEELKRLCSVRSSILCSSDDYTFSLFTIGQFDTESGVFTNWLGTHSRDADPFEHLSRLDF